MALKASRATKSMAAMKHVIKRPSSSYAQLSAGGLLSCKSPANTKHKVVPRRVHLLVRKEWKKTMLHPVPETRLWLKCGYRISLSGWSLRVMAVHSNLKAARAACTAARHHLKPSQQKGSFKRVVEYIVDSHPVCHSGSVLLVQRHTMETPEFLDGDDSEKETFSMNDECPAKVLGVFGCAKKANAYVNGKAFKEAFPMLPRDVYEELMGDEFITYKNSLAQLNFLDGLDPRVHGVFGGCVSNTVHKVI